MKFYEICFSPTGGTKKAADMLAEKLAEEIQSVDLTDYKTDFSGISLEEDDEAIIAVPSTSFPDQRKPGKGYPCLCLWQPGL